MKEELPYFKKREILFNLMKRCNIYGESKNRNYKLIETDDRDFSLQSYHNDERACVINGFEEIKEYLGGV